MPSENKILYGLRGITRISTDKIEEIIAGRPYESLFDFMNKVKTNKLQMINLIKSGAFDLIENKSREEIMHDYIDSITDKKQRLTLQNMQMLINKNLIPEDMLFYGKLFLFNKFLKSNKNSNDYLLNDSAINFISNNFDADLIENGVSIKQKVWDNIYKKAMEPMREYLKEHKEEMLNKLNNSLYKELFDKYAQGNISFWEMEALSFYAHEHELKKSQLYYDNFFELSEEPKIDYSFPSKNGSLINVYKLYKIIGTVIDKDKLKNTITLLTPTGVVNVKIYKNQYAIYDKQLSEKDSDGHKHVIESSWFKRGTKLMIQGIRRGDSFIPKKTKKSIFPVISKITAIKADGSLEFQFDREEAE